MLRAHHEGFDPRDLAAAGVRPVATRVTTGLTDGTNTEVTAGLQAGQSVVTGQSGGTTAASTGTTGGTTAANRTGRGANPLTGGGPGPGFVARP